MDHSESSSTKIYWTQDYSRFYYLHGNRDLDEGKIKKLIRDVESGLDLFKFCPILVNETMHIIDGQHRFYVCQHLKINVYYIIVPSFMLAEIARVNNNQNRWKMQDFLNCFIDAGKNKEHYILLKEFKNKYKVSISLAVGLLATGNLNHNRSNLEDFRNGKFQANYPELADTLMQAALEYSEFTEINMSRDFLMALEKLHENGKFSQKEMLEKLKKHDLKIEKRANVKEYLTHMEELFNYKNSIRKTIY